MADTMKQQLDAARFKLTEPEGQPYLSRIAYALRFKEEEGLGTVGVDKNLNLYYDPKKVGEWSTDELVTIMEHEIHHVLRDHEGRAPSVVFESPEEARRWNVAGDMEINDDLVQEGRTMPERVKDKDSGQMVGYVVPEDIGAPANLTAEEYYRLHKQWEKDNPQNGPGNDKPMGGQCGHVADGAGEPNDEEGDGEGLSQGEVEILRGQVAKDIQDYAKVQGNIPGWAKRWADEYLDATIPWTQELSARIRHAVARARGKKDMTYKIPNFRRAGNNGFILPSFYSPVPKVVFAVDTSGSMSNEELAQGMGEIAGVLKALGANADVTVLAGDAAMTESKKVFSASQVELSGGGGTDMRVLFKEAEAFKPQVFILFTDGYTPWPTQAPRWPAIVCLTKNGCSDEQVPDWARVVRVND